MEEGGNLVLQINVSICTPWFLLILFVKAAMIVFSFMQKIEHKIAKTGRELRE